MVELQILSKVLFDKSLSILRNNNIGSEHFITYKAEHDFIIEHYKKYGNVPDVETFLSQFKDFDYIEVKEAEKYLIETLQEQYMYAKMVPFVHQLAELVTEDAKGAVNFIMSNVENMKKLTAQYKVGYDIIKNSDDRKNEAKFRNEAKGLLGVTTGIAELDDITHGWLKEDFVVILGRTNEGKTWVLLFFLVCAWLAGVDVLLYSGEMSETLVGFRFDTLHGKFGNNALMGGHKNLGTEQDPRSIDDYCDYLTNLSPTPTKFIVVTPKMLGGKRLNISTLHQIIEQENPGIIGIDQISLMEDERASRGEQNRIKYTHISEDLFLTSEKYQIPILAPSQANREAKDKKNSEEAPEVEHISESDGVGQNATRVVSIKTLGPTMKFAIKKNRYGPKNRELLVIWDIDKGIVKPFLQVSTDDEGTATETRTTTQEGVDLF